MEDNKPKVVEYKLPEKVLEIAEGTIEYPSVIETDFYVKDALNKIMEKNLLLWSIKYYNGRSLQYKEGLVKFNNSNSYLYFIKRVDEETYKFFFVLPEESNDSVLFYLNSLKQFKTI